MKKLIVTSGKGGVGKSTLLRALIAHASQKNLKYRAFDGDGSNASLARFHSESTVVDVDGDLRVQNWFENAVVPALMDSDVDLVLLDLGSGAERVFRQWCVENDAATLLAEEKIKITVCHVFDPTLDAASPFLDTVGVLTGVEHVIWFNHGLAKGLDTYEPAKAFNAILGEPEFMEASVGIKRCVIPPLLENNKLDAIDLGFIQATAEQSPLTLFERMRVKRWMQDMSKQFAEVL